MTRGRRFPRIDRARLARGLAAPGTDLRFWASRGTVGTHDGDFTDPNAVLITPAGIEVDVILEPSSYPTTCWYGMSAGTVFEAAPIHSGDQVLVLIPDGDPAMVPEVIRVVPGKSAQIPVDTDGKPFFRNDRRLTYARGVPIDLRTDGGSRVLVNPDGSVVMNDGTKGVARETDPVKVVLSGALPADPSGKSSLIGLANALLATGLFTPSGSSPAPGADFEIDGQITGASKKVKAGD